MFDSELQVDITSKLFKIRHTFLWTFLIIKALEIIYCIVHSS